MDLLNLPEEVTEQIFLLLPVEDLLSCSLVNCDWRNAVNKNVIWKTHCNADLNLENMKSIVSPVFDVPKFNDTESLSPICEQRLKYMREIHLFNNFRNNRCVDYEFSNLYCDDKTALIHNYLLFNDKNKNMFHVWDIEGKPVEVLSVPYLLQMGAQHFQAVGNCLIIVQRNLFQVYLIDNNVVSLKLCRIFDREEHFSDNIPEINEVSMWYSTEIRWYPRDLPSIIQIVGNYFIGIIDHKMHIWDWSSGGKLKEDIIPGSYESVKMIETGNNSKCLFIALFLNSRNNLLSVLRCKILSYDLKKLEYTQFCVESNHSIPVMLFREKFVVLLCDHLEDGRSFIFVDSVTGKTIFEKQLNDLINPKAVDADSKILVFGMGKDVLVVDLYTQTMSFVFSVSFEVAEVYIYPNNIVIIKGFRWCGIEVWDIKLKRKLYPLHRLHWRKSLMMHGRSLPLLCLKTMFRVNILHFW